MMPIIDDTNWKQLLGPTRDEVLPDGSVCPVRVEQGQKRYMSWKPTVNGRKIMAAMPRYRDNFPVFPRNEWSARIREKDERLRHTDSFQNFDPHDQDGLPTCASADTEVLTENGFVLWPDYNGTDLLATVNQSSGMLEYQQPSRTYSFEYDGDLTYSTNRRLDFAMTPDHRMWVRKWDERARTLSPDYSFQRLGEIGWYVGLQHAPSGFRGLDFNSISLDGDRKYIGDDFIALCGLICSDGYSGGSQSTENWVSFCCFRPEMREQVSAIASRNGFHEQPSRPGVWVRYDAHHLADWVRKNCYTKEGTGSKNKKAPGFLMSCSQAQIRHFLHFFGDRLHDREDDVYYSSSKRMADDIQELHLRIGMRATLLTENVDGGSLPDGRSSGPGIRYRLCVSRTNRLCLDRKKHIETDRYKGLVYCATVPNSTLITRRNGTTLISGNCWANGPAHAGTTRRVIDGLPLVYLSSNSAAVPISGGHSGGDEADAGDLFQRRGAADVSVWPNNDTSRSLDSRPEVIESRKHHLFNQVYSLNGFDEFMSACLMDPPMPIAVAFNWWRHVISGGRGVDFGGNSYGICYRNNWGAWGDNNLLGFPGYITMHEGKGTPDSGFCIGPLTLSVK